MFNIVIAASICASLVAMLYGVVLILIINKKPAGSKKMADAARLLMPGTGGQAKIIADELKTSGKKKYQDMVLVVIVLFTGLLYAFSWAMALSFLAGAILFAAADYLTLIISSKAEIRMAEAARLPETGTGGQAKTGVRESFSLGFNSAAAGSLISLGAALLATTVIYLFAGSGLPLWGLALAAIITTILTWQKNSSGFFAVYAVSITTALVFAGRYFPDSKNAQIFPLAIFALGLLAAIIGNWFTRVTKKTTNISVAIIRGLVASAVITLAGSYFAVKYLLPSSGKYGILILFLLLTAGVIAAIGSIIYGRKMVILPAIIVAAIAMLTNFFTGTSGIMLAIVGVLSLVPAIVGLNLFFSIVAGASSISQSAELPDEAQNKLSIMAAAKFSAKNYAALVGAIAALAILLIFVDKFAAGRPADATALQAGQFGLANLKLLAGVIAGAALAYYFSSEVFADETAPLAISIILPILAGLIFGPVFLAGALAGMVLTNLLVKNINAKVLTVGVVSILIIGFVGNLYSLKIRLIILGAAIVAIAIYLIIKKLYGNRKPKDGK